MKGEIILSNEDRTVGFLYFKNFVGLKTDIDLRYLKETIKTLEDFREKGLAPERITLGIATENEGQPGIAVFFLDKKQRCGIAIAPFYSYEEEHKEE